MPHTNGDRIPWFCFVLPKRPHINGDSIPWFCFVLPKRPHMNGDSIPWFYSVFPKRPHANGDSIPHLPKGLIPMAKFRAWIWYHVRNNDSPQWYDIGFPKGLIPMEIVFLTYQKASYPWLSLGHESDTMLGITTLQNGMILSTLSISSHGFAWASPKGLIPMEIVFLTYKLIIFH